MSGRRSITIVLGVAAAGCLVMLSLREFNHPQLTDPRLDLVALDTPAPPTEVSETTVGSPAQQPEADVRQQASSAARAPTSFRETVDTSVPWGRSFEECVAKELVSVGVCKKWHEPRDQSWAPEVERLISDFVANAALLSLHEEEDALYRLECRATFCQVHLSVDRVGLADHLRSIGRYPDGLRREHEFADLTFAPTAPSESGRSSWWAHDRAEELRLTLILDGLLEEHSVMRVIAQQPAYREQDSFLEFELSRCPDIDDLCAAQ